MCTEKLGRSRVYPRLVEKPALVPNAFKRECGLPRAYLAAKLDSRYTYTYTYQGPAAGLKWGAKGAKSR